MGDEKTLATIPSADPDTLLEVVLCTRATAPPVIELRRLSWGEGIGWFRQHTLRLEAGEVSHLCATLRRYHRRWKPPAAPSHAAKIIPFPRPTDQPQDSGSPPGQPKPAALAELSR
ncbi:MAG: hypothetical protein NZ578_14810 [Candidatus Binatia bacterium]|nr:hypothetical protein [Candidatus Binatia bacterium]